MMRDGIHNAVIESVSLDSGDHNLLTGWLHLDYGGSGQGFGGYALYLPKGWRKHSTNINYAGHFIWRCMEIGGVARWTDLKGKTVRVRIEDGLAKAIGHIVKDDWFCPGDDFKAMETA